MRQGWQGGLGDTWPRLWLLWHGLCITDRPERSQTLLFALRFCIALAACYFYDFYFYFISFFVLQKPRGKRLLNV